MVRLIEEPEKESKKALIYMRCSTDEDRQQVNTQLDKVKKFVDLQDWDYEIVEEYSSAWNKPRPIFLEKLEDTKKGKYHSWVVFDLDRFSRDDPHIADSYLDLIVHKCNCRFISINDSIDSDDDIKWHIVRHIMVWQSNKYSEKLSSRIKEGIKYYKKIGKKKEQTESDKKIIDLWKNKKKTVKEIASELGIHTRYIHEVLGYQHGRRRKYDYNEVIRLYKKGKHLSEIARLLNMGKGSVAHALKKYKKKKE